VVPEALGDVEEPSRGAAGAPPALRARRAARALQVAKGWEVGGLGGNPRPPVVARCGRAEVVEETPAQQNQQQPELCLCLFARCNRQGWCRGRHQRLLPGSIQVRVGIQQQCVTELAGDPRCWEYLADSSRLQVCR
jgi:hypothetical protein